MWYVREKQGPSSEAPATKGPFARETILVMYARGELCSGQTLWTSEKIFPNPSRPRSSRKVRITEWRRWDELPDPTRRLLESAAEPHVRAIRMQVNEVSGGGNTMPHPHPAHENYVPQHVPPPEFGRRNPPIAMHHVPPPAFGRKDIPAPAGSSPLPVHGSMGSQNAPAYPLQPAGPNPYDPRDPHPYDPADPPHPDDVPPGVPLPPPPSAKGVYPPPDGSY